MHAINNTRIDDNRAVAGIRQLARWASLVTGGVFLLILFLAVTNEDRPQALALPVLTLLALTLLACLAAWRWERIGGGLVVVGAVGLGIAAYRSASVLGLGTFAGWAALLYGWPFSGVGLLFLLTARLARQKRSINSISDLQ